MNRGGGMRRIKLLGKGLSCVIKGIGKFGEDTYVSPLAELTNPKNIILGKGTVLERRCRLYANSADSRIIIGDNTTIYPYALLKTNGGDIKVGNGSTIHDYCVMYGNGGIEIGDNVHIAAHTAIVASEHVYEKIESAAFSVEMKAEGIRIENDVWIGINAVVLDGVIIKTGAVIGAGAVVTKDIPPYSVAVGSPARVIKKWR